ncbi:MAG: heme NO-binding domain-containing protein [Anaerolineae bacterium]|nr:heme NO-binding domain-containing protein [Gemmatimonadaceae bacterium]
MYGIIHTELRNYVVSKLGEAGWASLVSEAGMELKAYFPSETYPDQEIRTIVSAAAKRAGVSEQDILRDFGFFLAPTLLTVYKPLVKPEWRTLDLIENTEQTIHKVVRRKDPGALPPELKVARMSKGEVIITYTSRRRMCSVAKGIAAGVAAHYGETVDITELECMHNGDGQCRISVKLVS